MPEVEKRPAGTLTTERRYGIAISIGLILGGAWWAVTDLTENTRTSEQHYQVQGTSLVVDAHTADLEVRSGDVGDITVKRTTERNIFGSEPKDDYSGGRLQIGDGGCGFLSIGCDTKYVIVVPKTVKVTAHTDSGDLKASDLPGGADLKSSSGDIKVDRVGTDLALVTSSGDLEARDVSASTVRAVTSSGDVRLTFDAAPSTVEARTSSGDVKIEVPRDEAAYKVDSDSSSGDSRGNVRTDPASPRSVKARSSSGDVTVDYR